MIINMQWGEIIFGGVGAGLYGMFMYVLLAVFIAGLMVGRTPEYLGKKIEAYEIRWAVVAAGRYFRFKKSAANRPASQLRPATR